MPLAPGTRLGHDEALEASIPQGARDGLGVRASTRKPSSVLEPVAE